MANHYISDFPNFEGAKTHSEHIAAIREFLTAQLDLKNLVVEACRRLRLWSNEQLPAWRNIAENCCVKKIQEAALKHAAEQQKKKAERMGILATAFTFDEESVKIEAENAVRTIFADVRTAVADVQIAVSRLQTEEFSNYFKAVDEYVDSVLGVLSRALSVECIAEPLLRNRVMNAIISLSGSSDFQEGQRAEYNWDAAANVADLIPLSGSSTSLHRLADETKLLLSGCTLLETLERDQITSTNAALVALVRARANEFAVKENATKSARALAEHHEERAALTLSVMARTTEVHQTDISELTKRYLSSVWIFFTEIYKERLPVKGTLEYEQVTFERMNAFPPFLVHTKCTSPYSFSLRDTLDVSLKLVRTIAAHASHREVFVRKSAEISSNVPMRMGIVLFRLIFPLVPPILLGLFPSLKATVIKIDHKRERQGERRKTMSSIIFFSYVLSELVTLGYDSSRDVFARQSYEIMQGCTLQGLTSHLRNVAYCRCETWEQAFWESSVGGFGEYNLDTVLRQAHFVSLNS